MIADMQNMTTHGRSSRLSTAIWLVFTAWVLISIVGIWQLMKIDPDGTESTPPRQHIVDSLRNDSPPSWYGFYRV